MVGLGRLDALWEAPPETMPVLRVIVVVALAIASAAAYDAQLSGRAYTFDEAAAHCRLSGRRLPVIETEEQMHLVEQHCLQLGGLTSEPSRTTGTK